MGGAAAIPLSEIAAYCHLAGITDREEVDDIVYHVRRLDGVWLDETGKKKP